VGVPLLDDCRATTMEFDVPVTKGTQHIPARGNRATEDDTIHIVLNSRNL
jgi:hypothetical protein